MLNTDRDLDNFTIKCCNIDREMKAPVDTPPMNTSHVDTPQTSKIRKAEPCNQRSRRPSYSHTLDICNWDQHYGDIHSEPTTIRYSHYGHRQFLVIPPRTSTLLAVIYLWMVMPSCQHRQSAFQRRDQESLLATIDVEVSWQVAVYFGSGFPSKDVQRMSLLRQKCIIVVSDGGAFRNS